MTVGARYRSAAGDDVVTMADLEAAAYPADEAATFDTLRRRIVWAPRCTVVALVDDAIVGFVCGTRSASADLTAASMQAHDPDGPSLCIHSVVVAAQARRQGLGLALLSAYEDQARALGGVERLLLITKDHLIRFYRRAGFDLVGPSSIVHGRDPWFEMRKGL